MKIGTIYIRLLAVAFLALPCVEAMAETPDSTVVKTSDRGVMLNAESASAPRVINVGLPESESGAIVMVDGMRLGLGLPRGYFHWAGGNSYRKVDAMPLIESIIRYGEVSSPVNTMTKLGGDTSEGVVTARTSSNGLIRFDGWVGGPVRALKGWYYSAGVYVNLDPTSVNAPSCTFVDSKQIFQLNLTRRWKASEFSILYRYSWCGDQVEKLYNTAPFVYNGDGSVSTLNGFRMGYDCYFPADDAVTYMDIRTGEYRDININSFNNRSMHDISLIWETRTEDGWKLGASAHTLMMPRYDMIKGALAGIDLVSADKGFTYSDGTPYAGYVQNRMVKAESFDTWDSEVLLQAEKDFSRHSFSSGLALTYAEQVQETSTFIMAHTAEASPERIYYEGRNAWNLNRNSLYFDAHKFSFSIYAFDRFTLSESVNLLTGIRITPTFNRIHTAARLNGEEKNRRVNGFNLADPNLADLHLLQHNGVNYSVSESLNWSFAPGFRAVAEGFYSMTNKSSTYFKNPTLPSLKAIGNAQARTGVVYAGSNVNLSAILSYITSWNCAGSISVTKQIGGVSETIPWVAEYGIGTPGATLDGTVFFGGFKCHVLFTYQDPRYHNYTNVFTFSDGSTQTIDYTGNQVTGISKVMMEIDPSYKWKDWRVWGSARYYSRQYVSRTNYAYFNGRWETFGGLDWDWRKDLKVSLSFVNLLQQGGVKGSIDIADTIDDESALAGYVMAGTFIRPFQVDLSVTYKF